MWMSIEVMDGATSASRWADAHGDSLIATALSAGAVDWSWHRQTWGVVLELLWADQADWERFRASASVQAALDAVPDPVWGLLIYRGRGGSAGARDPRKPRPLAGAGAAALPLPDLVDDLFLKPFDQVRLTAVAAG